MLRKSRGLAGLVAVLGIVVAVAVVARRQGGGPASTARPEAVALNQTFDFGLRSAKSKVDHVFTLSNSTDRTLTITEVVSSCGCLVPELAQKAIPPYGSATVPVSVKLPNRDGFAFKPTDPQVSIESIQYDENYLRVVSGASVPGGPICPRLPSRETTPAYQFLYENPSAGSLRELLRSV